MKFAYRLQAEIFDLEPELRNGAKSKVLQVNISVLEKDV